MQDPSPFPQLTRPSFNFPEQEQLKCPRCDSTNTKFCYYNNYNLSQPRHFCKSCRRYWTKGGALRNIPVGGGTRKNSSKRSVSSSSSSSPTTSNPNAKRFSTHKPDPYPTHHPNPNPNSKAEHKPVVIGPNSGSAAGVGELDHLPRQMVVGGRGSFISLLGSSSGQQLGNFLHDLATVPGPGPDVSGRVDIGGSRGLLGFSSGTDSVVIRNNNSGSELQGSGGGSEVFLGSLRQNGWPDLSINTTTPGSRFL